MGRVLDDFLLFSCLAAFVTWHYARGHGNDDLTCSRQTLRTRVKARDTDHGIGVRHPTGSNPSPANAPRRHRTQAAFFSRGDVTGPRARENRPNGGETVASVVAET